MKIHEQSIVLTGAASGIGHSLLQLLATYFRCNILAVDRDEEGLSRATAEIRVMQAKVEKYACDLSKPDEIDGLFEVALEKFGQVDIFIANAGFAYYETLGKPDWERIENIFKVNVFSPIYSLQKMKEINVGRPYYVIATASAMAKLGVPGYALYGATKAALGRFEDAYRYEPTDLGTFGLVYPIATKTNFFSAASQRRDVPLPFPAQTAEKVAWSILRGILRNRKAVYPSLLFNITRIPQWWFEKISMPYQLYYASVLKKWALQRK